MSLVSTQCVYCDRDYLQRTEGRIVWSLIRQTQGDLDVHWMNALLLFQRENNIGIDGYKRKIFNNYT